MLSLPVLLISGLEGQPAGDVLDVAVEHDDGYIAIARWGQWRCIANTAERRVSWERRVPTPEVWASVQDRAVDLHPDLRKSMARAAHAGLIACGARTV